MAVSLRIRRIRVCADVIFDLVQGVGRDLQVAANQRDVGPLRELPIGGYFLRLSPLDVGDGIVRVCKGGVCRAVYGER